MIIIVFYSVLVIALIMLSAFFAGSETAISSLSSSYIRSVMETKPSLQNPLKYWQKNPGQILTFLLVGNNGAYIAVGVAATSLALRLHDLLELKTDIVIIVIPVIVTAITLFFAEIIPKIYGRQYAEAIAPALIPILYGGTLLMTPIINLLVRISDIFIKFVGGKMRYESSYITGAELRKIFTSDHDSINISAANADITAQKVQLEMPMDTKKMLKNLIDFSQIRVEEIMIPRTQIAAMDIKMGRDRIMRDVLKQHYSRVPIIDGSLDTIIGILYSKDLIASMQNKELLILQDLLRPVYYTPEMARVSDLMREFKTGKHHMAIVVDQYGGTAGLVTIEDIMEEIVGDIYDEYDEHEQTIMQLNASTFVISAREEIKRINDRLGLTLPENQYETLAALALDVFGKIPKPGDRITVGAYTLEIIEADKRKIHTIKIYT